MIRGVLLAVGLIVLSSCDTGDGTTLREPVTPTTLPPPDTTPLESVAIETTAPLDSLPGSVPAPETALAPPAAGGMQLFVPWADGGTIDPRYGCDGSNVAPAVSWADVPAEAAELALAFVDESNLSNGRPFIHWVVAGITADPNVTSIGEGEIPPGAAQALNFFGDIAWAGPCPDPGSTNTYRLTLFALNQQLETADGTPATELLDLINTVAIASADVIGSSTR